MFDRKAFRERVTFLRAGAETRRFHTLPTIQQNTVGHHSFNVAWLAEMLSPGMSPPEKAILIMACLEHDVAEHIVGDVPAPTKRAMGIRETWGEYEEELMKEQGLFWTGQLSAEAKRILKLADALDGAFFCCQERAMGNQMIAGCFMNFYGYVMGEVNTQNTIEMEFVDMLTETWEKVNG